MKAFSFSLLVLTILLSLPLNSCKREPFSPDFDHAGGTVIGKETCSADPTTVYWLIDLNVDYTSNNTFGDTLAVNGVVYNHLVKTKQLLPKFQIIGQRVSFDCHFSSSKIQTLGCTIMNPITYYLKEMTVISTGEIR